MKNLSLLFILVFVVQSCNNNTNKINKTIVKDATFHSEKIRDSIFENVIEITENDIITKGKDYIFNVSIPKSEVTPILFVSARIPLEILSDIYPEFPKLIVIAPNWNYYDEVAKQIPSDVGCAEPMESSIIYEFNRENGKLQKDSLVIIEGFPVMKFKITKK
jgi:hypothetical protein